MVHNMKLKEHYFRLVQSQRKNVELRLNKRVISKGDTVVFTNVSSKDESITTTVRETYIFKSFIDLFMYADITLEQCGFDSNTTPEEAVSIMREFYSEEEEQRFGVIGIEIELVP